MDRKRSESCRRMVFGPFAVHPDHWKSMIASALDMTVSATSVIARAPAKINLTLDVLGRRDDGFHDLRSLVVWVGLCDRLQCTTTVKPEFTLTCSDSSLQNKDNLALRAARLLATKLGRPSLGVNIELEKRIPIGAGLGGGSSDAATALYVCNELWNGGLTHTQLAAIGAEIGSDVPLFFSLPSAIIKGRGELVEPVDLQWSGWALLATVAVEVLTADVYRAWRATDAEGLASDMHGKVVSATSAEDLSEMLSNHLEPAVFRVCPKVAEAARTIESAGLGPMRVSGAGSTLFKLFDDHERALHTAKQIEDLRIGIETRVAATPTGQNFMQSEEG